MVINVDKYYDKHIKQQNELKIKDQWKNTLFTLFSSHNQAKLKVPTSIPASAAIM